MNSNGKQVGGDHYRGAFQPWDFTCDVFGGCFFLGNANKYITRWRKKNGLEDLRKAAHYLEKVSELYLSGRLAPPPALGSDSLHALMVRYADANDLPLVEQDILFLMGQGRVPEAHAILLELITDEEEKS